MRRRAGRSQPVKELHVSIAPHHLAAILQIKFGHASLWTWWEQRLAQITLMWSVCENTEHLARNSSQACAQKIVCPAEENVSTIQVEEAC